MRNKLKLIKTGKHTKLYLNNNQIAQVRKYALEETADEAILTLVIEVDKNIVCLTETEMQKNE